MLGGTLAVLGDYIDADPVAHRRAGLVIRRSSRRTRGGASGARIIAGGRETR